MTIRSADELAAEGARLSRAGHMVVILHPLQEPMAVELQTPFIRQEKIVVGEYARTTSIQPKED